MPTLAFSVSSMPSRVSESAAMPRAQFKAPGLAASASATLPMLEKSVEAAPAANGPLRVGPVRALPKAASPATWTPVEGGFVTRLHASSEGALALRVKLELTGLAAPIEVRVQGNDGRIEFMAFDPARGTEAWTPYTEGSEQMVEVFSPVAPDSGAVSMGAVLHFTASPMAKAASTCTISTACSTGDGALDTAMAERKKSVARMIFVEGTSGFACTGTLINTPRFPEPFFMTANHCINNAAAASSLTTLWFHEDTSCGSGIPSTASEQISGGAELVFGNYNLDASLLKLNESPPSRSVYAGWDRAPMSVGSSIFSISHPDGDTSRWAQGRVTDDDGRTLDHVQQFDIIQFSRGFIEGGSSGSGLFNLANGSLVFRGTLLGDYITDPPYSCTTATTGQIIYSRFDIFEPEIDQYISTTAVAPDDAPNRARDLFTAFITDPTGVDRPLNERTNTLQLDNRRIDYVGDLDVYRFRITAPAWVSTWTEGQSDTVGNILDFRGVNLESNDDWQVGAPYNFGITKFLTPGTYYVQVGHFEATGTGAYNLRMRADVVDANYTALWWNPAENGWGLNISHQGNTLFGTLYTYAPDGTPTWYSMSAGVRQADGSYLGDLASTTGPAFNSSPWNPGAVRATIVGTMRVSFTDDNNGTLTYNVGGAQVVKAITKLVFQTPPNCSWSASNRSQSFNFQDLWWGGAAESGWGVNLAHQGDVLFATLFTYDAAGQPRWFVMSDGRRATGTATYSGSLFRTTGPAFNAVPFTPITAANNTQVGTMTFSFTDGNTATMTYTVNGVSVTKPIQRLEFGAIKPKCTQPS